MELTVWVIGLSQKTSLCVIRIFKTFLGKNVHFSLFSKLPELDTINAGSQPDPDVVKPRQLPDLVIGDILLYPKALSAFLLKLRAVKPVDLIIITEDRSRSAFTRASQLGAVDYLLTPFDQGRLQLLCQRYLSLRSHLASKPWLSQKDLDQLLPPLTTFLSPKGSLDHQLLQEARRHPEGISSVDAARVLSLSPSSARRALEALAKKGYLTRVVSPVGSVGRPPVLYRPTPLS